MKTDERAASQWSKARYAYSYYLDYISCKPSHYALSVVDLLYVKNFKGGSATINEPLKSLSGKLEKLGMMLQRFGCKHEKKELRRLNRSQLKQVIADASEFIRKTREPDFKIDGFGPSFASTLLHFYFPQLLPILDKRSLNGSGITGFEVTRYNEVKDLYTWYPHLIRCFWKRLKADRASSIHSIDKEWFEKPLNCPPFK